MSDCQCFYHGIPSFLMALIDLILCESKYIDCLQILCSVRDVDCNLQSQSNGCQLSHQETPHLNTFNLYKFILYSTKIKELL